MKKTLKRYHYLGRKCNTFHFGEKTSKNKKYDVVAGIFHKDVITKHSSIRYENTHNLIDLRGKKNGNDSVNFIGSFDNLVMSNILDILLLTARLWLNMEWYEENKNRIITNLYYLSSAVLNFHRVTKTKANIVFIVSFKINSNSLVPINATHSILLCIYCCFLLHNLLLPYLNSV